jgi:hypothetical protein
MNSTFRNSTAKARKSGPKIGCPFLIEHCGSMSGSFCKPNTRTASAHSQLSPEPTGKARKAELRKLASMPSDVKILMGRRKHYILQHCVELHRLQRCAASASRQPQRAATQPGTTRASTRTLHAPLSSRGDAARRAAAPAAPIHTTVRHSQRNTPCPKLQLFALLHSP